MTKAQKLLVMALAGATTIGACKGLLDVTNPGPILDSSLYTAAAVPALVIGISSDLSNGYDEMTRMSAVTGDESGHGGSYAPEELWVHGIMNPADMNGNWSLMNTSRFEAESGVARMKAISGFDYDHSAWAARANMLGGFANRTLGEFSCYAVIDGGPAQDRVLYFQRADSEFTEAIRIAQQAAVLAAPDDPASIITASYAGRASVRAWQGKWTAAVADAINVATNFVYNAPFSTNSFRENNSLVQETYVRREFSLYGSQWAHVFKDPRVGWDTIKTSSGIQTGQDGSTLYFRQKKYTTLGSAIPLVHGTEMLMLRAEAALRTADIAGTFALINQQRAAYSMTALTIPPDLASAWTTLEVERGATVWLEARRLWDLQRWNAATGPSHNAFLDGRAKCMPLALSETQTNLNLINGNLPPIAAPVP